MAAGRSRRHRAALANEAWEALLHAQITLMRRFAADPIWDELSMREYDVLYTLAKAGTGMRLTDLNRAVLLSQPALSRLVDRMASKGLVERVPDPGDRRAVTIRATDDGLARRRRVGARHALSVSAAMTDRLTDQQMTELLTLCEELAPTHENRSDQP
ncbi:MarR family winged helix-turn-helix transcriptional regulator [Rhodococcus rhodnii]|uniref:MarR family winged helix-turn-helix transcriptional regulator n=1 Tax=Rhodococcus rhodnii TaxID=38312 RepID=UPI0005944BC7|nr:MarR family transcriptional regulator [Rhodococcus rhodnii]